MYKWILFTFLLSVSYAHEYKIDRVQVSGNRHTSEEIITQLMYFDLEKLYGMEELKQLAERSEVRLQNTFYFYSSKVLVIKLDDKRVKVLVKIQEGFLYRFGGAENGVFVGKDNLLGKGIFAGAVASANGGELVYYQPYLFGTRFFVSGTGTYLKHTERILNQEFTFQNNAFRFGVGFQFTPDFSSEVFGLLSKNTYKSGEIHPEAINKKRRILGASAAYKSLDNYVRPRTGVLFSAYTETYGSAWKSVLKSQGFYSVTKQLSLASKIAVGFSKGEPDILRQFRVDHFFGMNTTAVEEKRNVAAYLTSLQVNYEVFQLGFFGSTLDLNGFFQAGELQNKLNLFSSPDWAYGAGVSAYIGNPVNINIQFRFAINENDHRFLWTISTDLGALDEL